MVAEYPIDGGSQTYTETIWTITSLLGGGTVPEEGCGTPPIGCFLAITGSSSTDVTIRGAADGTITVGTTGASGNTTWYLNGAFYASGASASQVFTGLTAGVYDIAVEDSHTPQACYAVASDIIIVDGEFRTGDFQVTAPTGLTAVENPIIIGVGTAVTNPSPVPCITTLTVAGTIADGLSLEFNLTSPYIYNQTFYAKAYPFKTNYFLASVLNNQYGVPAGTNTATEIATSLAEALQKDTVIPKVYYINNSGAVVTLAAKENGSRFNLTATNVISSATGVTVSNTQAGTDYCDGQLTDNYSISCEVLVNTDITNQYPEVGTTSDYNRVAELILPFNPTNVHRFDISSILKTQVSTPMPDINLTGVTYLPSVMQPWYTKLSELYPLVPNTNTIKKRYKTTTDVQWTINSSLSRYAPNTMEEYLGDYATNINPNFTITPTYNSGNPIVVVSNYLFDTGSTVTTNIKFRIIDNYPPTTGDTGWYTGTSKTCTGFGAISGYLYVSGTTSGITHTFSRYFWTNPATSGYNTAVAKVPVRNVKFLTNSPTIKQIQRNSNEFLYFILPRNYGSDLKMRGDLYFYDGTEATGQTFFTIATGTTNAGGCMCMNLSYSKLGLANYEVSGTTNRKIKRAELAVWQDDGTNPEYQYTETKTYRFEIDEMPRKWGILFQNALGLFDAFDFIGIVEETISRDTDNYTVPLTFGTDGSLVNGFKNTATYNTRITKKVIANTGWIDEAHFDWLMELMNANNIYSTSTTNQNYVNLIEYSYKKSSLDDLFDIECTFEWTIYENNITI